MSETTILKELFTRGAHYGYSRRRRHPSVKPYLFGFKNRSAIVDLERTLEALKLVETFLVGLGTERKQWLLVGSKPEAQTKIEATAKKLNMPYATSRWIGGTLTNFPEIKKRLTRLEELRTLLGVEGRSGYTKQERARFQKELERLERNFGSLKLLNNLPAAIFVVDSEAEKLAVAEAHSLKIPIAGLCGTDCDIRLLDYPIIANDGNIKSIDWFVDRLAAAYELGLKTDPIKKEPV